MGDIDIVNFLFGRRFSLTEIAVVVVAAVLAGVYLTHNLMTINEQELIYGQAALWTENQTIRDSVAHMRAEDKLVFVPVLQEAAEARSMIPAPNRSTGRIEAIILGPDPNYINNVGKAVDAKLLSAQTGGAFPAVPAPGQN